MDTLQALAKSEQRPVEDTVGEMVKRNEKEKFGRDYHESYERLHSGPGAWQECRDELRLFYGARVESLVRILTL